MKKIAYEKVTEPIDNQRAATDALANTIVRQSRIFGIPFFVLDIIVCVLCFIGILNWTGGWRVFAFIMFTIFIMGLPKDYSNWSRNRATELKRTRKL